MSLHWFSCHTTRVINVLYLVASCMLGMVHVGGKWELNHSCGCRWFLLYFLRIEKKGKPVNSTFSCTYVSQSKSSVTDSQQSKFLRFLRVVKLFLRNPMITPYGKIIQSIFMNNNWKLISKRVVGAKDAM